jgi:hypothetical protein
MSTALSKDLATTTSEALAAAAGTAPAGLTSQPMPQLNGLLLQLPGAAPIFLVLNGYRCWIPDMPTFQSLFAGGATVIQDINIGVVSEGPAITSGAICAKAAGSDAIYLVTNGVKMFIPNMDVFNRYQFNTTTVPAVAPVLINSIPNGPDVQPPTTTT